MGPWEQEVANAMGRGISRRSALRQVGGGVAAVMLASLVPARTVPVAHASGASGEGSGTGTASVETENGTVSVETASVKTVEGLEHTGESLSGVTETGTDPTTAVGAEGTDTNGTLEGEEDSLTDTVTTQLGALDTQTGTSTTQVDGSTSTSI